MPNPIGSSRTARLVNAMDIAVVVMIIVAFNLAPTTPPAIIVSIALPAITAMHAMAAFALVG